MSELPMLCRDSVALAIREGRQTQHRVPVKLNSNNRIGDEFKYPERLDKLGCWGDMPAPWSVGDLLYVRECWRIWSWSEDGKFKVQYRADGSVSDWISREDYESADNYFLECSEQCEKAGLKLNEHGQYLWKTDECPIKHRPSILIPKEFCRTWVKVNRVWSQRIQDISGENCVSEGVEWDYLGWRNYLYPKEERRRKSSSKQSFETLWQSIYGKPKKGKPDHSWNANPYVWCVEFERLDR